MRYLFLLQGIPGSGKSTYLEQAGLAPWTVCPDSVRLLFRGPEMGRRGLPSIAISSDDIVWRTVLTMVGERLAFGDLTIVDATHTRVREVEQYVAMAQRHRYQTFLLSWRDVPLEECVRRNEARPPLRYVPEHVLHDMHARLAEFVTPSWITEIPRADVFTVCPDPMIDGGKYRALHVIGDLAGCEGALAALEDVDDELCVFTGDYGQITPRLNELASRPNVIFCEGRRSRMELAGTPLESKLTEAVIVRWAGARILVSHGGLSSMPAPERLALVPSRQLIHGVGPRSFDVDAAFAAQAPPGSAQVHARHREPGKLRVVTFGQGEISGKIRDL